MVNYKGLKHRMIDEDKGITELRNELNISPTEMAKISKGEYITIHTLEKLCKYFHVTPDKIIEFVDDQARQ